MAEVLAIFHANNLGFSNNCSRCVAALSIGQVVSRLAPRYLADAMVNLCQLTGFTSNSSCKNTYEASSFGASWTQVLAAADVAGQDGRYTAATNASLANPPSYPVSLFGYHKCDSPFYLALAALQSIGTLTGLYQRANLRRPWQP
ncbi:hypothetical protein P8C59_005016 [Phyllachora maydis]|uniref:Uncharacterized protein n=1 Tax=Phyllachora maydis TaxID=1825666 RepID=A0AAD9MF32_9PEZI|nr:hypothetical protein P8C59_005016 [Phyllachora maydis]